MRYLKSWRKKIEWDWQDKHRALTTVAKGYRVSGAFGLSCVCLGTISGCAHSLLLAVHSGVILGSAWGDHIGYQESNPG